MSKFQELWLEDRRFKLWLERSKKNGNYAYCKVCQCEIVGYKSLLLNHEQTNKHKLNFKKVSENFKINQIFQNSTPHDNAVKEAELILSGMLATNNLSFLFMDTLVPVIKRIFPDSKIAQNLKLKRSKATALVSESLGKIFLDKLNNQLKTPGTYFSLILDETTDISVKKQCAFTVIFYDTENKCTKTQFFDLVETKGSTAYDLFNVLKSSLLSRNIPLENLVGFSSDTANVMVGEHQSVFALLRKELPNIVCVKCSCHMAHLAASKACLVLPKHVEDLLRNIGSHFSRSSSRRQKFEEFQ
ncbi:uncharacterized protein LOC123685957 [Harmonia axyridis]|uniref:uncharacterized protein LOC123685957 n=1 Tax=Harmonia axyridis TaxID=115357 RepID=UPI001E275A5D|nr:uncharacterized protein LOC123685957 [Harmonia axyridis]